MNFAPKTKEEIETMNLIKPGIYHFRVANAKEGMSKSGNEMLTLTLEVYDNEGRAHPIFDYLVEAMAFKLYAFCESTGLLRLYQEGRLTAQDCIGRTAYVELTIEKGKESPQGGTYPDKNQVKKYTTKPVAGSEPPHQATQSTGYPEFDTDVPF